MHDLQTANIPYFSQTHGMRSVLGLNNNTPWEQKVEITLFNSNGKPLHLPEKTLKPGITEFKVEDLTRKAGTDFDSGSIEVMYRGMSMAVVGQVGVSMPGKRISFESREADRMDFASSRMNGIVWLPDHGAEAFLALTDTAQGPVKVDLALGAHVESFSLSPHETRLLKLDQWFGPQDEPQKQTGRAAILNVKQNGAPGDIIGTGYVLNLHNGYSSGFKLMDPASDRSAQLAGAGIRFGYADGTEGFPAGTKFQAPLILANVSEKSLVARVSVDFTISGTPTSLGVGQHRMLPGEIKIVELTQEMARLGITGPVDDAGVDITYGDAAPGSLLAHLTSVDQTGDYAFEIPIKDPSEISHRPGGSYPWTVENGANTIVHVKNTTSHKVQGVIQFRFAGGTYNPDRIRLAPYQTMAFNLEKLKHSGVRDQRHQLFPATASHGKLVWMEDAARTMIGRAEIVNVAQATGRSFSCENICRCTNSEGFGFLTPGSLTGLVGDIGSPFSAGDYSYDCLGTQMGPYAATPTSWSSSAPAVASVNSGVVSCLKPGSATINAQWVDIMNVQTGQTQCSQFASPQDPGGGMNVNPKITSILPGSGLTGAMVPVTIKGVGFGPTPTALSIGGASGAPITGSVNSVTPDGMTIGATLNLVGLSPGGYTVVVNLVTTDNVTHPSNAWPFTVTAPQAVPVNFKLASASDEGGGVTLFLQANFTWQSSSGNLADLNGCFIKEHVTFPNTNNGTCPAPSTKNCFYPPSPPWPVKGTSGSGFANPTDTAPGTDAKLGANPDFDVDSNLAFVKPYSISSFAGSQIFQYSCNNGSYVNLYGPASINYSMAKNAAGKWFVRISRSDTSVTSDYIIPNQ